MDLFTKRIEMGITRPDWSGQVFLAMKKDNELVHADTKMDTLEEEDDDGNIIFFFLFLTKILFFFIFQHSYLEEPFSLHILEKSAM